ncbi:diaminopropionate ammonia-lyase [Streptomyces sp. NBC_01142]|uniref:diaminopropionate ammonia-lyase n=1 Tax=Streptomyces sp. NBC_01142 TaxID=2975865 RepID=UPI00225873C9|nr:diaminopropionate ammonia-lyase [Streptomyces sp. NBC_01142]MCX4825368.1 diaminopropionate ammonia-lyase [Streptomyces sp. NBC_01142]
MVNGWGETGGSAGGAPGSGAPAWYVRPAARDWSCAPAPAEVAAFHSGMPEYKATPLVELSTLAEELGVGRVFVKDESSRLGLPAFKALGASWAIHRVLSGRAGEQAGRAGEQADSGGEQAGSGAVCLVTATDGNHGRAVARMARLFGARAHVFVPEGVHPLAADAIAAEGAELTHVADSYDEAVRRASAAADGDPLAVLVQDTAWPGYEEIPGWIVEGYSTLFAEIDGQLAAAGVRAPALVAVPAGVGSLAQAAVTHHRSRLTGPAPALLAVEPDTAACVLASLVRQEPVTVATGTTTMAGLNCGTPSHIAWPRLRDGLDAAVAVTDAESAEAARALAALGIPAGPCGAASLAGVRAALTGPGSTERRAALATGPAATVVLLSTEGAAANPHAGVSARMPSTPPATGGSG